MWNPFKKAEEGKGNFAMNMMAKMAMKRVEKMDPKEREKMMQKAFNPKNRAKMLAVMEQMKKSGQISEEQYRIAKQKLGF
jgi:hypothetical protein